MNHCIKTTCSNCGTEYCSRCESGQCPTCHKKAWIKPIIKPAVNEPKSRLTDLNCFMFLRSLLDMFGKNFMWKIEADGSRINILMWSQTASVYNSIDTETSEYDTNVRNVIQQIVNFSQS